MKKLYSYFKIRLWCELICVELALWWQNKIGRSIDEPDCGLHLILLVLKCKNLFACDKIAFPLFKVLVLNNVVVTFIAFLCFYICI